MHKNIARAAASFALAAAVVVPLSGVASATGHDGAGQGSGSAGSAITVGGADGVTTQGGADARLGWAEDFGGSWGNWGH